ncbi:hypothetical protein OH77DRAFT_989574 [Trametes cingulata]|nr:hypothetical protein OH77DRAFT_989574 [Trametes cingulata]
MLDLQDRGLSPAPARDVRLSEPTQMPVDRGEVKARATDPVSFIPADSLTAGSPSTAGTPTSTTDTPFFPSPSGYCDGCEVENSKNAEYIKSAVEGALIVAAVALMLSLTMWRALRLRRKRRPLRDFFRVRSHQHTSSVPTRPPTVPRTTGLPPTSGPPASVIYDTLSPPLPLAHRNGRRGRGRRTYAGDIDAAGRRGPIAHPEDPNEVLPEYDDKDVLPRYQDLEGGGSIASAGGPLPGVTGLQGVGEDAGRMAGVGTMLGRSPNGDGGTSDTDPLVTRLRMSAVSEDGHEHAYPPPMSSAESHEGHGSVQRHD